MWLLNRDEELTQKLTLISATHTEQLNGENTLKFECLEQVNKLDRVIYKDSLNKWHEFIVQEVFENKESINVYAEHSSYELHGDFIEDKRPTGTPRTHLTALLSATRWSIGLTGSFGNEYISYYRQSVYKSINDLCAVFNAYRTFEIEVIGNKVSERIINIQNYVGSDLGKRFTYSKDLQDVTRTVLPGDIVTALYGFGKGEEIGEGYGRRINFGELNKTDSPIGKMYVFDDDAKALWGRNSSTGKKHVFKSIEFDDITDKEELYQATKAKLQTLKSPLINYQANVLLLDAKHENVGIGDTVAIIDKDFRNNELRLKGKVFKIERDLIDGNNSVIELGNYIDNIADADKKLNEFVKNFRDKSGIWDKSNVFDKDGVLDSSYIKNLLEGWNDHLNGIGGHVYAQPGKGIITYDKAIDDNPTMAIQINGGGWRIANSKLANDEWDWRTVGTGDGIYGDQIIANSITANQLSADVGASLDISSNESINLLVQSTTEVKEQIETIELTPGPKGEDGIDGVKGDIGTPGRGIVSTKVTYQKGTSGTQTPTGTWLDNIPLVEPNQYLWTRTVITYTSGSPSTLYSIGLMGAQGNKGADGIDGGKGDTGDKGADGKGITSTVIEYLKSTSGASIPSGTWSTVLPPVGPNEYLWTRTTIKYTTGADSVGYSVGRVGKDGAKGDTGEKGDTGAKGADGNQGPRGATGTSVTGIVEYYGLSTNENTQPTSWTEITGSGTPLPKMTATNKYLWNYEKINFSDITSQNTIPIIVGVYGDKGNVGADGTPGIDGRSITSIQEKYQVSNLATGITRSTGTWINTPGNTTDINKYLWNYEIVNWNKAPTPTYVEPIVIGIHGTKGDTGLRGQQGVPGQTGANGAPTYNWIAYADNASGGGISKSPTGKDYVGYAIGQLTPTVSISTPSLYAGSWQLVKGSKGDKGSPGEKGIPGIKGDPGSDGRDNYTWVKYADTPTTGMSDIPTNKKYIGFAYNKPTGTESTNYGDYEWNLAPDYFDGELTQIKTTQTTQGTTIQSNLEEILLKASREEVETVETRIDGKIDNVSQTVSENTVGIEIVNNSITQEVANRIEKDGELIDEISSQVQQTVDSFDVIFNKIENDQNLTNDEVALIQSYFRINENGVIIGKSDSAIEFFAENNRVGFRENGEDIAYWEEGTMHVDKLIAVVTIMIGFHLIEKYESPVAGNTTIVRISD